jgi:hypothetical protein
MATSSSATLSTTLPSTTTTIPPSSSAAITTATSSPTSNTTNDGSTSSSSSSVEIDGAWQRFLLTLGGLPFESVMGASQTDIDQLLRESSLSLIDRALVRTQWLRRAQSAGMTTLPNSNSDASALPEQSSPTTDHSPRHSYDHQYPPQYHDHEPHHNYYQQVQPALPGSWNDMLPQTSWPPSLPADRAGRYQMFLSSARQPSRKPHHNQRSSISRTERALALRESEYYDPADDIEGGNNGDYTYYSPHPPAAPSASMISTPNNNNNNGTIVVTETSMLPSPRSPHPPQRRPRTARLSHGGGNASASSRQSALVRPTTAIGFRGVVEMDASRALKRAPRTKDAEPPLIRSRSSGYSATTTVMVPKPPPHSSGPDASLSAGASLSIIMGHRRGPSQSRLRQLATPRDRRPASISSKVSDEQNCFFKPQIKFAVATAGKEEDKKSDGKDKGWWGRMHTDGMRYQEELKKRATTAVNKPLDEKVYTFKPNFETGRPSQLVGLEKWLEPQIAAWKTQRDTIKPPDPAKYTFMPVREHPDVSTLYLNIFAVPL